MHLLMMGCRCTMRFSSCTMTFAVAGNKIAMALHHEHQETKHGYKTEECGKGVFTDTSFIKMLPAHKRSIFACAKIKTNYCIGKKKSEKL